MIDNNLAITIFCFNVAISFLAATCTFIHLMGCLSMNCHCLCLRIENSLAMKMMISAMSVGMEEIFCAVMVVQGLFMGVGFTI